MVAKDYFYNHILLILKAIETKSPALKKIIYLQELKQFEK
jgi:hypothetical protein